MRRPESNSCLLLPKGSLDSEDGEGAGNNHSRLSVTLLSKEELPPYSCERYYMLSEIEQQAHSTLFICDLMLTQHEQQREHQEQALLRSVRPHNHSGETSDGQPSSAVDDDRSPSFPPYIVLYMLWRPDMTQSAKEFVDHGILDAVRNIQYHVDLVTDVMLASNAWISPSSSPVSSRRRLRNQQQHGHHIQQLFSSESLSASRGEILITPKMKRPVENGSPENGHAPQSHFNEKGEKHDLHAKALEEFLDGQLLHRQQEAEDDDDFLQLNGTAGSHLYLVVDRVDPVLEDDDDEVRENRHQHQVKLAEQLSREVASHPELRNICEGITVGVCNHERAAPGLEACCSAIAVGGRDRRQQQQQQQQENTIAFDINTKTPTIAITSTKSWLGLVSSHPEDLLGLRPEAAPDAAQAILQTLVCAEWNGQGNLSTFAERAHRAWRIHHGLPLTREIPRRRPVPRRKRRSMSKPVSALEQEDLDPWQAALQVRQLEIQLYDSMAAILIACYLIFHHHRDIQQILWLLNPSSWNELAQKLREI